MFLVLFPLFHPDFVQTSFELFVDFTELFVVFELIHLLRALPLNKLRLP